MLISDGKGARLTLSPGNVRAITCDVIVENINGIIYKCNFSNIFKFSSGGGVGIHFANVNIPKKSDFCHSSIRVVKFERDMRISSYSEDSKDICGVYDKESHNQTGWLIRFPFFMSIYVFDIKYSKYEASKHYNSYLLILLYFEFQIIN